MTLLVSQMSNSLKGSQVAAPLHQVVVQKSLKGSQVAAPLHSGGSTTPSGVGTGIVGVEQGVGGTSGVTGAGDTSITKEAFDFCRSHSDSLGCYIILLSAGWPPAWEQQPASGGTGGTAGGIGTGGVGQGTGTGGTTGSSENSSTQGFSGGGSSR
jgi:hypothetical protein